MDIELLPLPARAPQSPSKYEEAAQCAASFYAIRGEWTTTESHSLRFIQNARVSKWIPAKKGDFMGEFFPPEPYLCPLSVRNQKVGACTA